MSGMGERLNLALVIGGLAALGASAAWYLNKQGLFRKLIASKKKLGSYVIVYSEHVGPYKDVATEYRRVYELLKSNGIEGSKSCGFYFDDPAEVPGEKCRTSIGMIVREGLDANALALAKEEMLAHRVIKDEGLKVGVLQETECMSIEFPLHGHLSILIAVKRGYPELMKHVDCSKHGCSLEVYNWRDMKLFITVPLEQLDDFKPFEIKKES
ncbi:hypothetical protein BSKO_13905 [Bryopsis sp. KO-2023]|nr:hypothetical protein BSKO_13905 [Bryopsis sp. KO-2023]